MVSYKALNTVAELAVMYFVQAFQISYVNQRVL